MSSLLITYKYFLLIVCLYNFHLYISIQMLFRKKNVWIAFEDTLFSIFASSFLWWLFFWCGTFCFKCVFWCLHVHILSFNNHSSWFSAYSTYHTLFHFYSYSNVSDKFYKKMRIQYYMYDRQDYSLMKMTGRLSKIK